MIDPFTLDVPRGVDALIRRAIAEKRLVRCLYQGLERIGEPHDYGLQKGRVKLLLWQRRGASASGKIPDWRLVTVPEIADIELLDERFDGQRQPPSGQHRAWEDVWARVAPPEPLPSPPTPTRRPAPRKALTP